LGIVIKACKKTKVTEEKNPNSRVTPFGRELRFATVAKSQKAEFTDVNEHFWDKHNAEVGVFLLTQLHIKNHLIVFNICFNKRFSRFIESVFFVKTNC